jgi:aldehyde:ferredoxin oxidoreductase
LHSILVCDFHHRPLSVSLEEYAEFVTAVTGDIQSAEDFRESAERIETTARLFNVREGFSRHDDTLPPRLFIDALEDGPASGWTLSHEGLDLMLDEYYASRGWDCNGIPLPETLIHYGVHLEEWDEC